MRPYHWPNSARLWPYKEGQGPLDVYILWKERERQSPDLSSSISITHSKKCHAEFTQQLFSSFILKGNFCVINKLHIAIILKKVLQAR